MSNTQEMFANHVHDNGFVDLDSTFSFKCKQCGNCCRGRTVDDIMLSGLDIFNLAKCLNMSPEQVAMKYARHHIGHTSGLPVLVMKRREYGDTCVLLRGGKCTVQAYKPSTCKLYPLGRGYTKDLKTGTATIGYQINPELCIQGSTNGETRTVRSWIEEFGLDKDEAAIGVWFDGVTELSRQMQAVKNDTYRLACATIFSAAMYYVYDVNSTEPFEVQFQNNIQKLKETFGDPIVNGIVRECQNFERTHDVRVMEEAVDWPNQP